MTPHQSIASTSLGKNILKLEIWTDEILVPAILFIESFNDPVFFLIQTRAIEE